MKRVLHIGRNQPCWCGSSKKYKHCHYGREDEPLANPWEAEAKTKKFFERKICSVPSQLHKHCKGGIVRAHTVARTSGLSKISRDGHVYSFLPASISNLASNNGHLYPTLRGTSKASTFSGFCSFHDGTIFSPIEHHDFIGTAEQCFLLGYRAVCREFYGKQSASDSMDTFKRLDSGRELGQQINMQKFLTAFEDGTEAGLFGIKSHKADYDNVLLSKDFSTVRSYSIHLERPPDIMCSSGLFPTVDFSGRALQDLSDLEVLPKLISFSSFASEKKGAIVFSWLAGSDDTCIPFIMSLHQISDVDLPNALVRFFFESTENLHLSPDWWDGLDEITKIKLIRRISTMANLSVPQSTSPYANDNVEYVDWQIRKRIALGFPLPSNSAATSSELK